MTSSDAAFPESYRELLTEDLLAAFERSPERIRQSVGGLTEADRKAHPIPGKWSIHEIVLHLADSEIMGAARLRQALAEPGARLAVYDQDVWARELAYADDGAKAFDDALDLFDLLRRTTARRLRGLPRDAWKQRHADHPEWGTLTLRQLLELYADHGERHLSQILHRRRILGESMQIPLLLEQRLY